MSTVATQTKLEPTSIDMSRRPLRRRMTRGIRTLGRYQLLREIARGGSGVVYRARNLAGTAVAIKTLSPDVAENDARRLRFYHEANSLMRIEHPHVVRAYEVDCAEDTHYLVMEYVQGETLAKRLMRDGPLPEKKALEYAIQLAKGLTAVHQQGILHRDISPKNILIDVKDRLKLVDFEFSKGGEEDLNLTMAGTGLGTPDFMSPEQFRKAKEVNESTDIYALGAILYVMVTGRLPFPGKTFMEKWLAKSKNQFLSPKSLRADLSPATAALIKRTMAAVPEKRPATATDFASLAAQSLQKLSGGRRRRRVAPSRANAPSGHQRDGAVQGYFERIGDQLRAGRLGTAARWSRTALRRDPIRTRAARALLRVFKFRVGAALKRLAGWVPTPTRQPRALPGE